MRHLIKYTGGDGVAYAVVNHDYTQSTHMRSERENNKSQGRPLYTYSLSRSLNQRETEEAKKATIIRSESLEDTTGAGDTKAEATVKCRWCGKPTTQDVITVHEHYCNANPHNKV